MKQVLITGAANGLGKALMHCFAGHGWQVYAADLAEADWPPNKTIPHVVPLLMDVTDEKSVSTAVEVIKQHTTRLDLIIPNAGIDRYMPLSEAPVEEVKEIFEVNFFGVYRVVKEFLPLLATPGGRILLIGSESYHLTFPFMPYPLTKRLIDAYGKILRQELHFSGIEVAVIRPGAIATRFISQLTQITYPVNHPRLQRAFASFTASVPNEVGRVISPQQAAAFIYTKAVSPRLKAVYRINNSLVLRLVFFLPFALLERGIRKKLSR